MSECPSSYTFHTGMHIQKLLCWNNLKNYVLYMYWYWLDSYNWLIYCTQKTTQFNATCMDFDEENLNCNTWNNKLSIVSYLCSLCHVRVVWHDEKCISHLWNPAKLFLYIPIGLLPFLVMWLILMYVFCTYCVAAIFVICPIML